jgi:ATP-dependent RNA helicase RhlE
LSQFTDFGLAAPILKALTEEGYTAPTPIQTKSLPDVMAGRDLLGIAQTGTGKTAAFALPILHRLAANPKAPARRGCRALVLSPTRELASQICDSFRVYGRHLRLSATVVFGGVPLGKQERTMAPGVDILVATPGRLLDLIDRRSLTLEGVEILVLDEADQMLDLGFIHALRRVVQLLPKQRQTLFFSATMPKTIAGLADSFLKDPIKVSVAPVATTAERVDQSVIFVSTGDKLPLLRTVLADPAVERTLVFTRTKHGADKVVRHLEGHGVASAAIHGNKSQGQRERALAAFRAGTTRVLIATDIAARGIDVDGVSHVINFDLPNVPESYVHRIGRTARAGAAGIAISFCNTEERAYLRDIERLTRLPVPVSALPAGFSAAKVEAPVRVVEEPKRGPAPHSRGGQGRGNGRSSEGGHRGEGRRDGWAPHPHGDLSPNGQRNRRRGGGSGQAASGSNGQANGGQNRGGQSQGAAKPNGGRARPAGQSASSRGAAEGASVAWLDRARRPSR